MSALLLAPFNDSMRLGQGYNSFLQTPCLGNSVNIENATLVESKAGSTPSQTVAYSARFVEKMSEVVRAMNISAGSSIRTGSVSVSGGGNSIDEVKFAESDLNAVISVKVVNQTRNLRDNVTFNKQDISDMDSARFHEIYGDTFISGFVEGGDLHGIISIKTIDASKKTELKNKLKSQFNGKNSEWSPSSSGEFNDALRQAEVTVNVNWSGGGLIKPSNEEWTIDSLLRAASAFSDNVAQCPQRTWAILTRYDTVPSFVEWSCKLATPISVRRYEGVQRFTSELLDMYMEYKSNLLILNDAIRHEDRYVESNRLDRIGLELGSLIEARKALRAEMTEIVSKIEALDKNPAVISEMLGKDDITAPELWRARLPFRRDITNDATSQNVFQSLLQGLPLPIEAGKTTDASESLDVATLQTKLAHLEDANQLLERSLDTANNNAIEKDKTEKIQSDEIAALRLKVASAEAERDKTEKIPSDEIATLRQKVAYAEAEKARWLDEGLCPPDQLPKMPRHIREWAVENATKWPDCRLSWISCGVAGVDADETTEFQCSLDSIAPVDGHVVKVSLHVKSHICGVRLVYRSGRTVDHGSCDDEKIAARPYWTADLLDNPGGFLSVIAYGDKVGPKGLELVKDDGVRTQLRWANSGDIGEVGLAPPGYSLRGVWTQLKGGKYGQGDHFERIGFIWGRSQRDLFKQSQKRP